MRARSKIDEFVGREASNLNNQLKKHKEFLSDRQPKASQLATSRLYITEVGDNNVDAPTTSNNPPNPDPAPTAGTSNQDPQGANNVPKPPTNNRQGLPPQTGRRGSTIPAHARLASRVMSNNRFNLLMDYLLDPAEFPALGRPANYIPAKEAQLQGTCQQCSLQKISIKLPINHP